MGRALLNAIPAFIALAAGYQAVQAVFACVRRAGVDRGCVLGGYFWLTAAALVVLFWIVVHAAFVRRAGRGGRSGRGGGNAPGGKPSAGKGPGGEGQGA